MFVSIPLSSSLIKLFWKLKASIFSCTSELLVLTPIWYFAFLLRIYGLASRPGIKYWLVVKPPSGSFVTTNSKVFISSGLKTDKIE